jgi:hypothetical protein
LKGASFKTTPFSFYLEATVETVPVFGVGECVRVVRDLPSIRAGAEGIVRGVSTNASGITYAIRFAATMRIVSERDLGANDETSE